MATRSIIDWHSHVLPSMDDGSKSPEMSLEMLKHSRLQGITHVMATPHFYADRDQLDHFLKKREQAEASLKAAMGETSNLPVLLTGAEVTWFYGISGMDGLSGLCLADTRLLLLEMPFDQWSGQTIKEVERILDRDIIPVIAHIERFLTFQKDDTELYDLLDLPVILQFNGDCLESFFKRRPVLKLMEYADRFLLGSDMHNPDRRPPDLDLVRKRVRKYFSEDYLAYLDQFSEKLLF